MPRMLLRISVGSASPSTSSATISNGLPVFITSSAMWTTSCCEETLLGGEQNVRVVEHGRLVFRIGDEVGGNITLVEAHALGEIEIEAEAVVVFDGDDAILSDLVESLGDLLAHLGVTCGNRCGCSNLFLGLHRLRGSDKLLDESVGSLLDAAAQGNRIGSGHHVLQTLMHEGLCKYSCGGGAIAGDIIGALGHFLHQFGTNALERILKIDLLGDRNAIVGDVGAP